MSNENFEMEKQVAVIEENTEISDELLETVEKFELMDGLIPMPQEPKPKKKLLVGIVIAVFTAILCVFAFKAINGGLANQVEKIFAKVGMEITDTKIICAEPLNFSEGTKNSLQFILFRTTYNDSTEYVNAIFDLEEEVYYMIDMKFPFRSLRDYASTMGSEQLNEDLYYEIKARLEMGGTGYFENPENSMLSFKEVVSEKGLISVEEGRRIMLASLPSMYGEDTVNKWKSNEGFCVLFEIGTAVPKVIVAKTMVNEYQWEGIYPEGYVDLLDYETQVIFKAEFGPAYKLEEKWVASVINSETGDTSDGKTFDSLEAIKAQYKVE